MLPKCQLVTNQALQLSYLHTISWGLLYSSCQAAFFEVPFHAVSYILDIPWSTLSDANSSPSRCVWMLCNLGWRCCKNQMLNNVKWCYRHNIFAFQTSCWGYFLIQKIFTFNTYAEPFGGLHKHYANWKLWWLFHMVIS